MSNKCKDCNQEIHSGNTSSLGKKNIRCGVCYVKHKRAMRAKYGEGNYFNRRI